MYKDDRRRVRRVGEVDVSKLNEGKTQIDAVAGFHRGYRQPEPVLARPRACPEVYYNYERSLYDFADLEGSADREVPGRRRERPVPEDPELSGRSATPSRASASSSATPRIARRSSRSITQRVKAAGYHVFKAGVDAEFSTFDINKSYTGGVVLASLGEHGGGRARPLAAARVPTASSAT